MADQTRQDCCVRCWPSKYWLGMPMIVCPECGNKRCPKAAWHGYKCTGSNEPGQARETEA